MQNKPEEQVREPLPVRQKTVLKIKNKQGVVIDDLSSLKSQAPVTPPSVPVASVPLKITPASNVKAVTGSKMEVEEVHTIVTHTPIVDGKSYLVELQSAKTVAVAVTIPVPVVAKDVDIEKDVKETQAVVTTVANGPVSAIAAEISAIVVNEVSPVEKVIDEVKSDVNDAAVAAEAEVAAAAKASADAAATVHENERLEAVRVAEAEMVVIATKKAEEEALLKKLQDEEKIRIEIEKKRLADEEEEKKKVLAAKVEARRLSEKAAEIESLRQVAEERARREVDDAKRKADLEAEKKKRLAEEEEKIAASTAAAVASAAAVLAADSRSKKEKLKDAMAAKDTAINSNSMLDAYSAAPVVVAPVTTPVVVEVKVEAEVEEGDEKDWEAIYDQPVTPALPVAPVAVVRRLVPGGGGSAGTKALNAGPAPASKLKSSYPKAELMKFRPAEVTEADRPHELASYVSIKSKGGGGGSVSTSGQGSSGDSQKGGGAWNRGEMKGGQGPPGQVHNNRQQYCIHRASLNDSCLAI